MFLKDLILLEKIKNYYYLYYFKFTEDSKYVSNRITTKMKIETSVLIVSEFVNTTDDI